MPFTIEVFVYLTSSVYVFGFPTRSKHDEMLKYFESSESRLTVLHHS